MNYQEIKDSRIDDILASPSTVNDLFSAAFRFRTSREVHGLGYTLSKHGIKFTFSFGPLPREVVEGIGNDMIRVIGYSDHRRDGRRDGSIGIGRLASCTCADFGFKKTYSIYIPIHEKSVDAYRAHGSELKRAYLNSTSVSSGGYNKKAPIIQEWVDFHKQVIFHSKWDYYLIKDMNPLIAADFGEGDARFTFIRKMIVGKTTPSVAYRRDGFIRILRSLLEVEVDHICNSFIHPEAPIVPTKKEEQLSETECVVDSAPSPVITETLTITEVQPVMNQAPPIYTQMSKEEEVFQQVKALVDEKQAAIKAYQTLLATPGIKLDVRVPAERAMREAQADLKNFCDQLASFLME